MFVLSDDRKWYRAGLRLMGDGLPIEKVETLLGLKASSVGVKDKYIDDNPNNERYSTNIWTLKSGTNSDVPFDEQISILLDLLEPKHDALIEILSLPDVKGELFLGSNSDDGQDGAFLSQNLIKRIADFGLSIDLDLYTPEK